MNAGGAEASMSSILQHVVCERNYGFVSVFEEVVDEIPDHCYVDAVANDDTPEITAIDEVQQDPEKHPQDSGDRKSVV